MKMMIKTIKTRIKSIKTTWQSNSHLAMLIFCACKTQVYVYLFLYIHIHLCVMRRGGGLGSRPKKMYGERLGDGVEYHLMSPTPRR